MLTGELAEDDPDSDALIGEVLASRYRIESKLGQGAMGAVYRARHVKVGRPFAVKVLHRDLLEDPKVALRFEREAELAGRLRHPNVIGVVDVGETSDGLRYMVMDFAAGRDLAAMLDEAPMPPVRIIGLVRQMLEGLYHAHEAGLIHRDFKPENVIIERDDHGTEVPRIVDFGIAILREGGESADRAGRLTTNGLVLGTPHYMAPEQAVADPIDHRIDLFALGIVIYEMLSGKLPFDGTGAEVARANLLLDPPPIASRVPFLEVDPLLEAFARRLLAKKRDRRPPTAKVARELLDLIARDRPAAAAALGVPLDVGTRLPAATEPTVALPPVRAKPRPGTADELDADDLDDVAAAPPVPVAVPELVSQPVATEDSVVTRTDPAAFQPRITTASGSLDEPPRRRRGVYAIAGLVAAGGLAAALIATRGGSTPAAPPPAAAPVAEAAPAPTVRAEEPLPTPPPAVAVAVTPDASEPPAATVDRDPAPAPTPAITRRDRTRRPPRPVATPTAIAQPTAATPAPTPVAAPPPTPPVAEPADPIAAFNKLYNAVNAELTRARSAGRDVDALSNQWRMIKQQQAMTNPQYRDEQLAALRRIRAALAQP